MFKYLNIKHKTKGMSSIEVMVWIGVMTILMGTMTIAIINIYRSNSYTFERALAIISVRRGLEQTTQLIREAVYSDSGGYPIVAISANSFSFYADYDKDGDAEMIRIFLDGNLLNKGVVEPVGSPAIYTEDEVVSTIVDNLRNATLSRDLFSYYDESGSEVVNMSDILNPVFVKVDIVANTGRNPTVNDYELHGSAFIRNLKN